MELKFKDQTYTEESLKSMSDEDLLTLRNEIAESISAAPVSGFKDHDAAVAQTWKALTKAQTAPAKGEKPAKAPKAPKEPKERKPRGIPKSSMPKEIKRPTRKHFATILKVGEHDGTGKHGRPERWPNYTDGMTIAQVIEGNGTETWDVYNWESLGIMKVVEPTDAEYAERRAAWFQAKGRPDPELVKAEKASKAKVKAEETAEA